MSNHRVSIDHLRLIALTTILYNATLVLQYAEDVIQGKDVISMVLQDAK
jgi:hypothetical protein